MTLIGFIYKIIVLILKFKTMKRGNFFYLVMSLFFVISCNDDLFEKKEVVKEKSEVSLRSAGDGNYDLLGYGYDATKEFANANSAKAKVVDIDKIIRESPSLIEAGIIGSQYGTLVSGKDYREYTKNVSLKVKATGSYKLFTGALNGSFSQEELSSRSYSYASYDLKVQRRRLTIYANESDLYMKYLTPDFMRDYKLLSAEQLINKYGTHVLKDIVLGGKLSIIYRCQTDSWSKKEAVEAGISVGVSKIFNIDVNGGHSSSEIENNRHTSLRYYTIGGDPSNSLIGSVKPDGEVSVIDIAPWQKSVTLANAQLVDINEDGLIPLYRLIPDSKKRNEVKDYIFSRKYELVKNRDYLLNGSYTTYGIAVPFFPKFFSNLLYQTDDGIMTVIEKNLPELNIAEKNFLKKGEVQIENTSLLNKDEFNEVFKHLIKYTPNLDLQSPYPVSSRKGKDAPILVQEKQTGKYFIQLDQRLRVLRPLHSEKTIEVYNLNKNEIKIIENINEYEIGDIFI